MRLHDPDGKRLYLTAEERRAFLTPLQALLGELGKDVQIRFA